MVDPTRGETAVALVGVDVGGTFTDAVVVVGGRVVGAKAPTTPADQGEGVMAAITAALASAGVCAGDVGLVAHGMTVGTNALLERTGARTALVATAGFEDVLELRRQDRASLYHLDRAHPPPLVPTERTVGANERTGPDGIVQVLTPDSVAHVVRRVRETNPEAVAVGLLFSYAYPGHERQLAAALREAMPEIHVCTSSDVLPEIREYERIATTVLDAYLTPVLREYLLSLGRRAHASGLPAPAIMQSNGGLIALGPAAEHAARTVLSGPAGGVIGAAHMARHHDEALALTFDMGGTSCDVALINDGEPTRCGGRKVVGHPVHMPMLDIETVSAGGGSIAWADSGGALRVGPRSAGAVPGPAAYGCGGTEPTVTDANVVLERLDPDVLLGDIIRLDSVRATEAVASLASPLGLGVEACAKGIIEVAVQEMVRALRVVSVERGIDPREGVLVAFGGAGPLHACAVADEIGIRRITCPAAAGVLAALGMVVAGERRDHVQTVLLPVASGSGLAESLMPLADAARRDVPGGRLEIAVDCRYVGQSHAITVPWNPTEPETHLAEAFHAAHRQVSGGDLPGRPVEAVSIRVAAVLPGPRILGDRAQEDGPMIDGPRRIPMDGSTCWVAEGWRARMDTDGTIRMDRR